SAVCTTGPHEVILRWPNLLPLLQSANVNIESDYVFWLERYRSPQTSVSQPLLTTMLHLFY
ncbi:MAG: hypothetical protein Q8869_02810, partial [Candidatus Phytoplasma australasiaticum]|nr:hypothetical protein [Candidatus Phytoplasma australasiaticum]